MMKDTLFLAGLLVLSSTVSAHAATDYYLKLDSVEGEASAAARATTGASIQVAPAAWTGIEPDEIDISVSDDSRGGKVEFEWKVEEGEKNTGSGTESDKAKSKDTTDPQPLRPDFSILLGGGRGNDDEAAAQGREQAAQILFQALQEDGSVPTESIAFNFGKISLVVKEELKLFGLFSVAAPATVEIDAESRVKVKYPWWAFLAAGKEGEKLGDRVAGALAQALEARQEAVKNAISNIR